MAINMNPGHVCLPGAREWLQGILNRENKLQEIVVLIGTNNIGKKDEVP